MVVMRKRKITVRPYKHPRLKFVVGFREAGKRKRSFFETRAQANAFAAFKNAELRKYGVEGAEFSSRLREMARECAETLSAYGKTIADATKFFVDHLKASERSITAAALVDELVAAKKADEASQRHVDDLRSRLNIFARKFDGQMVATITTKEIDDWLRSLNVKPVTRNHYRRLIILAFNFAVAGGYATDNPAEKTAPRYPQRPSGRATIGKRDAGCPSLHRDWFVRRIASCGD